MSFNIVMQLYSWLQAFFRRYGWLLALIVVVGAATVCKAENTAAAHLGRGYELIQEKEYQGAASEFQKALALQPDLPRARYQLAICLFGLGRRDESEQEFERLGQTSTSNQGVPYYLGRLRLLAGDNDGAIRFLKPISAEPPLPDTSFYLGCAYLAKGDLRMAITALKRAETDSPRDFRVPYRLARAHEKAGRKKEAAVEYQRSNALRQGYNTAAEESLECGRTLKSGAGAAVACRNMFDPNDPDKLTALGIIYGQHGAYSEAIRPLDWLRSWIRIPSKSSTTWG